MKFINHQNAPNGFERLYNEIRGEEERILSLEQIQKLPYTAKGFRHHGEWNKRIRSTSRFENYITDKKTRTLLDIGCGNGWLLYKLARKLQRADGIEINKLELEQATTLLAHFDNVELHYGDIFSMDPQPVYDIILLNACIQYFDNIDKLIGTLRQFLSESGEVHILDSPIYKDKTSALEASTRTKDYYDRHTIPEMAKFYHHHCFEDFANYNYQILFDPRKITQRIKRKFVGESPFPWIKIQLPR